MFQAILQSVPALIGREAELTRLWEGFAVARGGQTTVVALAGEPGIGKSRLLAALAERATGQGALILRGGAVEAEGMPPYLPFLEALGRYARTAPLEALQDHCRAATPTLALILPELARRLGQPAEADPLPAEQARLRLYEAVTSLLANIAAGQPVVLVLDDLHWADPASLDLLRHIVRTQPALPLLIAIAYRPGDAADNPALERARADLRRLRALVTVELTPLAARETAALAASQLTGATDATLAALLHDHSEGNPFFAEELLRAWAESGVIEQSRGRWRVARAPGEIPPGTILETVRQRLAHLPAATHELLRTAAVIGRQFDAILLAGASGQEAEGVEEQLIPAVRAQLIDADGAGGYRFGHDRVRECLYAEVTPLRRRRLHGFIGGALVAGAAESSAKGVADLAFHFARSGDRARGAHYSRLAAGRALAMSATGDAIRHFRMALDLLDADDPERGALFLQLGGAALLENAETEVQAAFGAAREWFLRAGDRRAAARAAHGLGQMAWRQERLAAALAAFEEARDLLGDEESPESVQVLTDLGSLLAVSLARQDEGLGYGHRALAIAQALGDRRLEATAGRTVGNLLIRGNDFAAGLLLLEGALALAVAIDDPAEAAECCGCLAVAYDWLGDIERAIDVALRRRGFAERTHDAFQLRHVDGWLAAMYCYRCRWDEAERLIAGSREFIERLNSPEPLATWHILRGMLAWLRGDFAAAEEPCDTSIALLREIGPAATIWYLGNLAITKFGVGKHTEALALMAELDHLVAEHPPESMASAEALTYLTQLAISLGDRARADAYAARLARFRDQHHGYLVDRLLGECAILRGDWGAAGTWLGAAEANAQRYDNQMEGAHLLLSRAELALARGGAGSAAEARALLARAVSRYQQLGMTGWERRARERLRALPSQPLRRPAAPLPAGLSGREASVLRLVAEGKSNREIAAALALSEKTIANHLTGIFNKIGVDNRAAAAVFAARHGLAEVP
ncbi:MAG: AAA family ATPase [Thermomicrobiales bacterium]